MANIQDRRATPVTFQLTDVDGNDHDYLVTPHSTTEAEPLLLSLGAAFAPLLAQVVAEKARADRERISAEELLASNEVVERLGAELGTALSKVDAKLLPSLLTHVRRDGEPLRDRGNKDAAFAGNLFEYAQLLVQVVKVNKFLPF